MRIRQTWIFIRLHHLLARGSSLPWWASLSAFLAFAAGSLLLVVAKPPVRTGDGFEYYYQNQSFFDHATPDLQQQDLQHFQDIARAKVPDMQFLANNYQGYFKSLNGNYYSFHFWAYPFLALPVKFFLHLLRLNEIRVLELTNWLFFMIALLVVVCNEERWIPVALFCFVGPVLWYLKTTGPEAILYALFLGSLVLFHRRKYGGAAAFAALAAAQFILFFPWMAILLALYLGQKYRDGHGRLPAVGMAIFLILIAASSLIFYYAEFRTPSLIAQVGAARMEYISAEKMLSLFFDLNFGLLVFYPALVFILIVMWRRYSWTDMSIIVFILLFVLFSTTQINWNAGMMMINRYGIIIAPVFVYPLISRLLRMTRQLRWSKVCPPFAIALNLFAFLAFSMSGYSAPGNYVRFSPVATLAFRYLPALYNPQFEVFTERAIHADDLYVEPTCFPVYYIEDSLAKVMLTGLSVKRDCLSAFAQPGGAESYPLSFPRRHYPPFYRNYRLNADALNLYGLKVTPDSTIGLIPILRLFPDTCSPHLKVAFQVPLLVVNRTQASIGEVPTYAIFHVCSSDGTILRRAAGWSALLPRVEPGKSCLTLLNAIGVEKELVPYIQFGMTQQGRGWVRTWSPKNVDLNSTQ